MDIAIVRCEDTYQYNDIDAKEEILACYAAATLEVAGFSCQVYDMKLEPDLTPQSVLDHSPSVIAIPVRHPGDTLYYARRFVRRLRRLVKTIPHITLFGHSNVAAEENLKKFKFDSIVTGEEQDLVGLVRQVVENGNIRMCPGVAYLDDQDRVIRNPPTPLPDLNTLPLPKRYHLEKLKAQSLIDPTTTVSMQTSRGCYASCSFCFLESEKLAHGGRYPWRARSIESVLDEIEQTMSEFGVQNFYFYDTDFFGPGRKHRKRGEELARKIIDRGLDISFFLYARANDLTSEGVRLLKAAGLTSVFLGIESFSQPVLCRYNKATTVEDNLEVIRLCKEYDIYMQIGYITYDYYTTFEELWDTIRGWKIALDSKTHLLPIPQFLFTAIAPLDGTPIGAHYESEGITDPSAKYNFPSWIIPDIRMKSPVAPYTFRDPRIAQLAECTRLLSYELAKKVVAVHKLMKTYVEYSDEVVGNSQDLEILVNWMSKLSSYAICQFEQAVEFFMGDGDLNTGIERMFDDCRSYYKQSLPKGFHDLEIYDRHYAKLRERQTGFVEQNWEGLLEVRST